MLDTLKNPGTQQFLKFAVVGLISFAVDWLLLVVLTDLCHVDYLVSTSVSFVVSVALNYALSVRYVFPHRDDMSRKREFTIFAILSAIGLALTDVFMFVGVTVLNIDNGYTFAESIVCALGAGFGFMLAMVLFSGVRKRLEDAQPPKCFEGLPITLVAASVTALSFGGFGGIVESIFGSV